ncbi:retrotransposon protein putative ty3-gypsy sub-class [Cucumis melo var. makuwa]|uniref:Retrotransposon protein putative ty3-gypsy sub-class n=1 Tax=Cucumis melo var. makuwa TaxID=1194695 RepID=A0A5A7TXJ5_CUCMM|nr:retrotransposon protein putative ty3-gypsy sub-class [Cucumis melo var. makuwa]TYK08296.1 retrotransposon protein putative ty3-gypsy sub-class [Cucumis melo var. makuwa]
MESSKARIVPKENSLYDNFDSTFSKSKKEAHPDMMSVMMADITAKAVMTEMERKINFLMKVVEERDHEIIALRNTRLTVSMMELTNTKQWKREPVIDYINRWKALSLDCKDRLTELSAVEMCTQGMHLGLLYILQGIKPRTFKNLATGAHDMELSIVSRGTKYFPVPEVRKDNKETKGAEKIELNLKEGAQTNHAAVTIMSEALSLRLIFYHRERLVQFGTFEPIVVQFYQEVTPEDSQEKEKSIEEDNEGWIIVTRRKKRKSTSTKKESHFYRNYGRGNKAQKNKKKKKIQKPKLVHKEDKDFPQSQRLVTLTDFFPTRFLCDHRDENLGVVACHAINATEKESILPRSLEEEGVSKDLSRSIKFECSNCDIREYSLLHRGDRILFDNGSAVNIMSKSTMRQLGILMDELLNSKLVIQDSKTTYKLLLDRSWIHGNGVETLTLHQCFKFYQDSIKKVEANSNPFLEVESHFADAKFYLKNDNSLEALPVKIPLVNREDNLQLKSLASRKPHKSTGTFNSGKSETSMSTTKSMILMDENTSNPSNLRYVPLSRRKKDESSFVESPQGLKVGDIEVLKEIFTTPLTKITKQEIKIDLMEASLPQRRTKDGFDPKAYKLMAKAGYNFTAHIEFDSLKIHEQP